MYFNILTADLIELGIGNLASPKIQAELDPWLEGVELLVLDNLSSLTAVIRDNDAESWNPNSGMAIAGCGVVASPCSSSITPAREASGRDKQARGRADTSVSLRRPSDYMPTEGARFEVHFEKARHPR